MCVLCLGQGFKSQPACVQDVEQQYRNVKACAFHAMKVYMGIGVWLHSALDGVEWSTPCFGCFTHGIEAKVPIEQEAAGPQSQFGCFGKAVVFIFY